VFLLDMKVLRKITSSTIIGMAAAYFVCMVVVPVSYGTTNLLKTWENWQSFNAGMIGLLAATLAIYSAYCQYINRLEREFDANKALLPSVLSILLARLKQAANYCVECYLINTEGDKVSIIDKYPSPIEFTELQQEIIKNCIANAQDDTSPKLIRLLHEIQVLNSRVAVVYPSELRKLDIPDLLILIAKVYALGGHLLTKVRDTEDKIPIIEEDDINTALFNLGTNIESIARKSRKFDDYKV
jgi:hypothetical protein